MNSTPTFTDSLLEHKKLKDDISALKLQKEVEKRECALYTVTKTALLEELKNFGELPDLKDRVLENLLQRTRKEIDDNTKKEQLLSHKVLSLKNERNALELKNNNLKLDIGVRLNAVENVKEETEQLTNALNVLKVTHTMEVIKNEEELKNVQSKKEEEEVKINAFKEEYSSKMVTLVETDKRLSVKGSDLAIYEARLRKACLELYPEVEIILSKYD